MCALMSLDDVQAKSPFTTPLATTTTLTALGGCQYDAALGAENPVNVRLVATTFDSNADALEAMAVDRQTNAEADEPTVVDVAGLGEGAFAAGADIVGVETVVGDRLLAANFKGEWPDTTDAAKISSGTALLQLVLSRLP